MYKKQSHYIRMETQWGERYSTYSFMTLALDGGECHIPARLYLQEKDLQYPLDRRLDSSFFSYPSFLKLNLYPRCRV
jgi:hypothetical protein